MGREAQLVEVADPRYSNGHLRLSWHPVRQTLVVSHWRDGVCVATTPVALPDIPALIGLLVSALQDAATTSRPEYAPTVASIRRDIATLVRGWNRSWRAPVADLVHRRPR